MGVIAVETRGVDRFVPADPSNPESSEVKETMGGKVWFPDSAMGLIREDGIDVVWLEKIVGLEDGHIHDYMHTMWIYLTRM